ncbi:MAG: SocA family protein [Ignavibacteriaceae bacterium]|nr:SocA family protein [Ignavibacteriaceae bacterium]
MKTADRPLDRVAASIVYNLDSVNVFHYNKLIYLFEYLFIKNFGVRYTQEKFTKLPHGPVVSRYKHQIKKLTEENIFRTDIEKLMKDKEYSKSCAVKILIGSTSDTKNLIIKEKFVADFIQKVIERYSGYSATELEKIVYKTPPMQKLLSQLKMGYKKETGSYILKDGIRFSDYRDSVTRGRLLALEHSINNPEINTDLHIRLNEELSFMKKLRPEWAL